MLHDCMLRRDHVDSFIVVGKDVPEVNVGLMLGKEFFISFFLHDFKSIEFQFLLHRFFRSLGIRCWSMSERTRMKSRIIVFNAIKVSAERRISKFTLVPIQVNVLMSVLSKVVIKPTRIPRTDSSTPELTP